MDDRRVSLLAASVGGLALGGFWLARPSSLARLNVVEQWAPPQGQGGSNADAAVVFRVDTGNVRFAASDDRTSDFQVVDARGRGYPLVPAGPGLLKLQTGYPKGIPSARVVMMEEGRVVASAKVDPIPDPVSLPLVPHPHPDFALVYRGGSSLETVPRHPFSADERLRVAALRTRYAFAVNDSVAEATNNGFRRSNRLFVPYAETAGAVEVQLDRFRLQRHSTVVRIPGLRIVRRFGHAALAIDRPVSIDIGNGLEVQLPDQNFGPHRPSAFEDARKLAATLNLGYADGSTGGPGKPFLLFSCDLISPTAESLGLRELRIGSATSTSKTKGLGPLKEGPFTAVVRVGIGRFVRTARSVTTVPVEIGAPSPLSPFEQVAQFTASRGERPDGLP